MIAYNFFLIGLYKLYFNIFEEIKNISFQINKNILFITKVFNSTIEKII